MPPMGEAQKLDWVFTYHSPTEDENRRYVAIRTAAKHFA